MRMHGNCRRQLAVAQDLEQLVALPKETLRLEGFQGQLGLAQLSQTVEVENGVFGTENVGETALGQTAVQRHLAAFKTAHQARTRTGALSLVATGGCFTVSGAHTTADTLAVLVRLLRRSKIGKIHDVLAIRRSGLPRPTRF